MSHTWPSTSVGIIALDLYCSCAKASSDSGGSYQQRGEPSCSATSDMGRKYLCIVKRRGYYTMEDWLAFVEVFSLFLLRHGDFLKPKVSTSCAQRVPLRSPPKASVLCSQLDNVKPFAPCFGLADGFMLPGLP